MFFDKTFRTLNHEKHTMRKIMQNKMNIIATLITLFVLQGGTITVCHPHVLFEVDRTSFSIHHIDEVIPDPAAKESPRCIKVL